MTNTSKLGTGRHVIQIT